MNDRLNRAVERLLLDKRFLRRFRRDPEGALRQFELTSDEVEAVKRGDARELVRLGLDPDYAWPKVRTTSLSMWFFTRAKKLTPALVLAALLVPAAPAAAAKKGETRARSRVRVARVRRVARADFGSESQALADKLEDAVAKLDSASAKLQAGDLQGALGELEGAVGDLEAAVKDQLLPAAEGNDLMNRIASVARALAEGAIEDAAGRGGNADKIDEAGAAVAEGDSKRDAGQFKDAVARYKDALAKAEGA